MAVTNKPKKELGFLDLDMRLVYKILGLNEKHRHHGVPHDDMVASCRSDRFGREKTIRTLHVLVKKGVIFRRFYKTGYSISGTWTGNPEANRVIYKNLMRGDEILRLLTLLEKEENG